MAKNWNPSWASDVGVNNVPSYQVSGRPFAYHQTMSAATKTQVQFPYVSRWVYIVNNGSSDVKVAFSSNGLNSGNANFFVVPKGNGTSGNYHNSVRLELKVSELWLYSAGTPEVSVVAGMTSIRPNKVSGSIGPSWSGSLGVS